MIDVNGPTFWSDLAGVLWVATGQTLYMVFFSLLVTVIVGLPLGIVIVGTERGGLFERPFGSRRLGIAINRVLNFIVNLGRAVPFIILMIALIPFTRLIVGTFIGTGAAVVPLSVIAIPFFARMVELSLKEVDQGLVEAAHSIGASNWQIVRKVLLPEALPSLVLGGSTTITSIINFSAMAGVVAAGGLGDVAIRYGYQRYSVIHIVAVIIELFIIVMVLQGAGSAIAKRLAHKNPSFSRRSLKRALIPEPPTGW
jgi:D-methionine transport system permease protein